TPTDARRPRSAPRSRRRPSARPRETRRAACWCRGTPRSRPPRPAGGTTPAGLGPARTCWSRASSSRQRSSGAPCGPSSRPACRRGGSAILHPRRAPDASRLVRPRASDKLARAMICTAALAQRSIAKLPPLAALLLWAFVSLTAGAERLDDPTQAFVHGYDPSGNDFLANVPERTLLLHVRARSHVDVRPG